MKAKWFKNKPALLGFSLSILLSFLAYLEFKNIGYPDGHLTEFGKFSKDKLFPLFFILNTGFSLFFLRGLFTSKKATLSIIIYSLFGIAIYCLFYYFSLNLENGQGG